MQAKKTFATICIKLFDQTLMNIQSYQALSTADKNRIQTCISVGPKFSWQVFNENCQLVVPQNDLLRRIFNEVEQSIFDDGSYTVKQLFGKYLHAPYGMNTYSLTLFILYFIRKQGNMLLCFLGRDRLNSHNLSNSILKDGKLKFSELQRITIQKNRYADVDVVAELCNEILKNTDVYKCSVLRTRLDKLVREEGESGKNQMLIGQAKMRLDDGENLCHKLNETTDKIKQILDEANAKFIIHKFIGVFEYIKEPSGLIEDGLPYIYSQNYMDIINSAKNRIEILMGDTYSNALATLQCSDITKLGAFQNTYKRVINTLTNNGYADQASAAAERVNQIVEETKAKNRYNQAFGEFEKEFALHSDISRLNYGECTERISKFESWGKFFSDADIPTSIKEPVVEKIKGLCKRLDERKIDLLKKVSSVEAELDTVDNLDDLLDISDNLQKLIGFHFEEDVTNHLEVVRKKIDELRTKISIVPNTIDEIQELISLVHCKDSFDRVYLGTLNNVKEKLLNDEQNWIIRNLIPAEDISSLDAQQCTLSIEKLRSMPAFASKNTSKRVQQTISKVEDRLHECKVQGVFALFNSLSEDEKNEFLRLINRL